MITSDRIALGIILLLVGVSFLLITPVLLRAVPRGQPTKRGSIRPPIPLDLAGHNEATLLVQAGGRVIHINPIARDWFNIWEEEPNLERLGRRTRPGDAFLSLCASQGRGRFSLDGRVLEGTSYEVPYGNSHAILVSLRRPQLVMEVPASAPRAGEAVYTNQAFTIFTELSRAMASSLDLETTLQAILDGVQRLIPADFYEITVWEPENRLLIPYRFTGTLDLDRKLEKGSQPYTTRDGYPGYLATRRQPLLIPDVDANRQVRPAVERPQYPYQSYLGTPLEVAGELVGTLELASLSKESFSENDLEVLRVLAGQAAVALHNALLYEKEERRATELGGLARLAQAASAQSEPQDLFARLVESIAPLIPVEILGFLIYDENRHILQAVAPFQGIPIGTLEWARFPIPPGSEAERLWLSQDAIVSADAPGDLRLKALGIHELAAYASLRHLAMIPLAVSGRILGYLQVANKQDGAPFDQTDLRLLSIIAGQAAPIIENAHLVQQTRRRAQRAETLRRIASLTASAATLDEILKYSLQDLARLLQADHAAIFLLETGRGELRVHRPSMFGVQQEAGTRLGRMPIDDPQFNFTVTGSQQAFISDDVSEDPRVLPIYRPLILNLETRSAIAVPLVARERSIGEMMLGSRTSYFFNQLDLQSVTTAAGQIAGSVERASLYTQTDESLRRRVDQLTAVTRISRELNSTLDLEHLLERVHSEAVHTTQADCGSILLFELRQSEVDLGIEVGSRVILQLGDPPGDGLHPLEKMVLENGETVIVEDFDAPGENGANPEGTLQPAHAGVRSAMVVPISYQEQIAGLIHLHARAAHRFDDTAREIAETLAIQAAIALGNAHRYQEQRQHGELLNRRMETLARLLETTQSFELELPLEQSLENIAYAIQSATPFNTVVISVYDPATKNLRRITGVGLSLAELEELQSHTQAWSSLKKVLKTEFRVGRSYFIPYEQMPVMPTDVHTLVVLTQEDVQPEGSGWHPEDVLVVPLFTHQGDPLGLISVDAPRDNQRPDRPTIETLEIFGSQASLAIESHHKLSSLNTRVTEMERETGLAVRAAETARSSLPVLLHKDVEQTLALERLSQRTRRIQAGIDISEIINRQADRSGVLLALGREMLTRMGLDIALVVEPGPRGPHLLHTLGALPAGVNAQALLGQRNPLHQSLQTGENFLVARLDGSGEWANAPLLQSLEARAFICLSILTSSQPDSAILAISHAPLAPFTVEDEQLFTLLARQVAITLQNLTLLIETSQRLAEVNLLLDFSRRLGSLDSASILQALVESAMHVVPAAQASLVALWDPRQNLLVPQAAAGYSNNNRMLEISYHSGEAIVGQVYRAGSALRLDEVDFARHYNLSADQLVRYRDATGGRLPVSSLAVPIQQTQQALPLGVVLLDNFQTPDAFTGEAQALVTSLAQQTALHLENTRLYRSTQERASQLQALTRVAAAITTKLKPEDLVAALLDEISQVLPYDTGILWLRQDRQVVVRAARGFTDSDQRLGLTAAVEDSALVSEMILTRQPIYVSDVRADERFPSLLTPDRLSWLGLPLIASGEVIGVIALEKQEADFYTNEQIQIGSTFSGQAAVALENARLYHESQERMHELNQRSQRLEMLNRLSTGLSGTLEIVQLLGITVNELSRAIPNSGIAALTFEKSGPPLLRSETPSTGMTLPYPLPDAPIFERLNQSLGIFNTDDIEKEADLVPLLPFLQERQARSLLVLPLATGNDLHGLILAQMALPYRYSPDETGLARTISNQAAIAIQNARLFAETRSFSEELEKRVLERTAQVEREHHRTETLLRISTELTTSLDLEQVLNRTMNLVNQIVDAGQITVLIARPGERKLHRLASIGYTKPVSIGGKSTPFNTDEGLAGWVLTRRQAALIEDVLQDPRWILLSESQAPQHRSAMAVPLMVGAEALGVLLLYHPKVGHFSKDQLDLVQAAANQVAVAINNAELYRLIRDQAEDLGNMFRSQQIEASRSRAILEGVADGVLVTDADRNITLFNASAETILILNRTQVIGQSLEHFIGLFGRAARHWMKTIQTWSQNPTSFQAADIYAEQITLEDGRVVEVHLSPVSLRETFLGTVSVFRDITHEVELDRLKSEFVATVSHELRTPMTSIRGYVDIMLMGAAGQLNEQQTHFLEIVKNNTERLGILVNDLLDISRIEAGRVELSLQPINLEEVARAAILELEHRSQTEGKPMNIELSVETGLQMAEGDLERVRQIIDNLLENAYYYTPANGQITLRLQPSGDQIQIDVQDNGIGIAEELQPRVFERFYRGEHPFVLATSGTGLGLSITQHLVEMHGGQIWLKSTGVAGEGSIFSFTLPVYQKQ